MLLNHSISSLGIEELISYLKKKPLDLVLLQGVEFRDFWRGDRQYLFFPFSFQNQEESSLLVHKKLLTARFYKQEKVLHPSVLSYKGPLRGKNYYQSLFSTFKLSDDSLNIPYYVQFLRVKESKEAFSCISFHDLLKGCLKLVDENSRIYARGTSMQLFPMTSKAESKSNYCLLREKSLDLNYLMGSSIRKSLKNHLLQQQIHLLQQKKSAYKVERFYASKFNPWHSLQSRCKIPEAYLPLTSCLLRVRFTRLLAIKCPDIFNNKILLRGVLRLFVKALKVYGKGREEFLGQTSYTRFKGQLKSSGELLQLSIYQKNLFLSLAREALKAPEVTAFLSLFS